MHIRKAAICSFVLPLLYLHATHHRTSAQDRLSARELRHFESKIRPVLAEHCYACHASDVDEPGGDLVLDNREGLRQGGQSGPAVIPRRPNSSLILLAIKHAESKLAMPPKDDGEKLSDEVIADFERWILAGAPDPRDPVSPETGRNPSRPGTGSWEQSDAADHWAWEPPLKPDPPEVDDREWASSELDRFVLANLEQAGIRPSPPADRLALVRRLAIDLTGLPPMPDDLQEFALSNNPASLETYVDKLLDSERYGERFGRHWLDVARYAESSGKDVNVSYPHAWRYRDYVIDALNSDLPFDKFIVQQLAGDLMPATDDQQRRTNLIATGFLAIGPKSVNEMNPRQFAADVADEQIDAISQAFLGVTISCARCHDHKFDPISQQDYTAMAGILLSTETHFGTTGGVGGRNRSDLLTLPQLGTDVPPGRQLSQSELENLKKRIRELESQRRDLYLAQRSGKEDTGGPLSALRISQQLVQLNLRLDSVDENGNPHSLAMGVNDKPPAPRYGQMLRGLTRNMTQGPQRLVARELSFIHDSPQLVRGEIDKPGESVPRGLPEFLAHDQASTLGEIQAGESGRLQLAEWIASERNPLTSRVIVNRVWNWLMGEGLVGTEDNFGTSGELPSNPELLDFLASDFVENGWSLKYLVRKIVLSECYQQASDFRVDAFELDSENRLHWRANKRALDAESLRDGMLAISGRLQLGRSTGSVVSQAGDGLIGGRRGLGGLSENAITDVESNVRSVYLPVPRSVLPDALQLFDFADNSNVTGDRDLTIVPSQALYWMNSPVVEEQCEEIATSLLGELASGRNPRTDASQRKLSRLPPRARNWLLNRTDRFEQAYRNTDHSNLVKSNLNESRIEELFRELTLKILARPPFPAETRATVAYVQDRQRSGKSQLAIWTGVTRSLFSSADYRFLL